MLDTRKTRTRILFGIAAFLLGGGMLLYLVPQGPASGEASPETVATVGDQSISTSEIRQQLSEISQRTQIPKQFQSIYARQILDQLVFEKALEFEAKRLGIRVSDEERAERIRQYLPDAYNGDAFIGYDRYSAEVQSRFQMPVAKFEEVVGQGLLMEKFRKLVTDGISASPDELQQEFRYRNEKLKLDYAFIKPEDLESKVTVDDTEIKAAYDKNKSSYQVPEKRVVRYGLIDTNQLRQTIQIPDDELRAQYQQDIQQYEVPNRVHVQHILFMTVGKTDAEVEETRKKAEDVLKQARSGKDFTELAKQYSEDPGSKDKGGDLGWIVQGQTVPEFQTVAFSLEKGKISELVKTQYGFHIIKVLDKETAHTKPFEEVKDSIRAPLVLSKADKIASDEADQMSSLIRRSNKTTLDDLAKQFHLGTGETRPISVSDPILEFGNSQDAKDTIFRQRQGELSTPIRTDRGYLVLDVTQIIPAHQGSLEEVRDKVISNLKQQKATELAHTKADELAKRAKAGEKFAAAAKALGLEAKTSDLLARNGSISGAASGKQLSAAFNLNSGEVGSPLSLGTNWMVYQVVEKQEPNPSDFEKQKKDLTDGVLQSKRDLAFQAFRTALETRLRQEGKLKINADRLATLNNFS